MFLKDYWYVAAFDDEVGRGLFARTILGEDLLLFRKADGSVVALEDKCAHRRLPLSAGRLIGDTVECGYHGLTYDGAGRCLKIPGQAHGAAATAVRAYPVIERHRFIYVWMGDPARADPATIISFPRLSDPARGVTKVRMHIKANHLLGARQSARPVAHRLCPQLDDRQRGGRRGGRGQDQASRAECPGDARDGRGAGAAHLRPVRSASGPVRSLAAVGVPAAGLFLDQ
ncbi:MAG: Rieske 2Fe-2S domain-containing protein [Pseudomonadota bacterium]